LSRAKVRTTAPDGTGIRWLGELGPVTGLRYSWTLPGGCETMTCALGIDPRYRTDALNPGRLVDIFLGGSSVWDGILGEPEPDPETGWNLTAIGSGMAGSMYRAIYTGTWAAAVPDLVINNARSRGLGWVTSSIGTPTGLWTGQAADSGSMAIDEVLNQVTSKGPLTWQIKRTPRGDVPQMFTVPTTPNRLLVTDAPAARTLGGDINAISIRYQSAPDLGAGFPAVYSTTWVTDDGSIARHGRLETFLDISSAGPMLATDAQAVGNGILTRYQRASYAGPFPVRHGQLLTLGGSPVDLGCFYGPENGMCVRLILADQGWGGEVTQSVPVFAVGRYEYDDDTDTATIEPFNSIRGDFQALADERAGLAHGRRFSFSKGGGSAIWWFGKYAKSWSDIHRRWRNTGPPSHGGRHPPRPGHRRP
jgi:hypothetical protein